MTEVLQDIENLEALIGKARAELDAHAASLREVDAELERLAVQREQHQLLETACSSLDRLAQLGAAELFWGESGPANGSEHLRRVRERSAGFREQLAEIEERRRAIVDEIGTVQERLVDLEDDLFDAQQQEERRKLEWIVEREISALPELVPLRFVG